MITLVLTNAKTGDNLGFISAWDEASAPAKAAGYAAAHRVDVEWRIATDAEIKEYMDAARALQNRVYATAGTAD